MWRAKESFEMEDILSRDSMEDSWQKVLQIVLEIEYFYCRLLISNLQQKYSISNTISMRTCINFVKLYKLFILNMRNSFKNRERLYF